MMNQPSSQNLSLNLSAIAYRLADSLRQRYLDRGLPIPVNEKEQAIATLMQNFAITQTVAESALAKGFSESR